MRILSWGNPSLVFMAELGFVSPKSLKNSYFGQKIIGSLEGSVPIEKYPSAAGCLKAKIGWVETFRSKELNWQRAKSLERQ